MSYAVLHMDKYKKDAIRGIQSHNQRERESHTNPDINYAKSNQNYDLHNPQLVNFMGKIQERIDEMQFKKAVRKDAVYMCGIIVSSDQEFFKDRREPEIKRFFEDSYDFLAKFVGKENIISATVHMDEKTPHMHFMHVPITKDNKLSAKEIYTRESLQKLQTDYVVYMQSRLHGVQRGVSKCQGSVKKHLDTPEFKQQMEALKQVQNEIMAKQETLGNLQSAIENKTIEREHIQEDLEAYTQIATAAKATRGYQAILPKPGLTNAKKIYDEAMQIISVQRDALTTKELVESKNDYLEAQNANLMESHRQISSTLKVQEVSHALTVNELNFSIKKAQAQQIALEEENAHLKTEIQDKNQFIEQPQVKPLYLAYQKEKEPKPEKQVTPILDRQSQTREPQKRSRGFER